MVKPKKTQAKRGRPFSGGRDPIAGVRMPPAVRAQVEAWAGRQKDQPSFSEAVRRLVLWALGHKR